MLALVVNKKRVPGNRMLLIAMSHSKMQYGVTSYPGLIICTDTNTVKIMEELIQEPINKALRDRNRINDCQHDFMENRFYQINLI